MSNSINVSIKDYRFNIAHADERVEYEALCADLESRGLKKFAAISMQKRSYSGDYQIDTDVLFDNQYNTVDGQRIFEWEEPIVPNKNIKAGYYIDEGLDEVRAAQSSRCKCGYCGHQYEISDAPEEGYCTHCRDSEYLTPKDFKLLKLTPILEEPDYSAAIPEKVFDDIVTKQTEARVAAAEETMLFQIEKSEKEIEGHKKEYEAKVWLITNLLPTDNVIYYQHTGRFCFGWRTKLSHKDPILDKLTEFPFEYDVKFCD